MQGLRQYAVLGERERRALLDARLIVALCFGAAMLWIPVAFTGGVVLAGRGILHGVGAFWPMILAPAGLLLCVGLCARGFDRLMTERAHRDWRRSGAGDTSARRDAADWLLARSERLGPDEGRVARPGPLRLSSFGFGALALALPLPIVLLAVLSAVGPSIAGLTTPRLSTTIAARVARTELLRPYAVPTDESISAREAGESMQVLSWVGDADRDPAPVERPPVRRIAAPWIPVDAPQSLHQLERLPRRVFDEHEPLTEIELDWLKRMSAHPGHDEIARVARARSVDIVDTRWKTDEFEGESAWNLPFYRFSGMRRGAYAHIALGLLAADRGDPATAELRFREVISMGLLLTHNGPTVIDMLLGIVIAESGADALRGFYESAGRPGDAGNLTQALQSLEHAEKVAKALGASGAGTLRTLANIAANEDLPPGIRWESLMNAQLSARCQSPSAVLFGAGDDYNEWLAGVHDSLVRHPSEAALFEMIGDSRVIPQRPARAPKLMRSLLTLTFGESGAARRCADIATALASVF
jgi:hypothetical protein